MKNDLIILSIGLYIMIYGFYWICGGPEKIWAFVYYFNEKFLTGLAFYLLYRTSHSFFMRGVSLYGLSLCVFMMGYFIFTYLFGHNTWITIGSFLIYSFVILIWIRIRS